MTTVILTFVVLPGHGGLRSAHRQAKEAHVIAFIHGFILRDVHYPSRHCKTEVFNYD